MLIKLNMLKQIHNDDNKIVNMFGKVKGDVKVNSAFNNNMSCCNETIHKNILAILLLN